MSNIQYYEKLIQEKRKKTPFRDFVKELASWDVLNLYRRNGKISRYPESDRIRVLDDAEFQNASSYSREYDLGKSFFANFRALSDIFPYQYLLKFLNNENADFADAIFGAKNAYLSFVIGVDGENVTYSAFSYGNTTNIHNCFFACKNVSNAYMSAGITTSHNIFYSKYITDSSNIWFSSNLIGCEECIGCDGLQNQKYAIGNRVLPREEYLMKKGEILRDKKGFDRYYQHVCDKKAINFASEDVTGNFIIKSHHVENGGWIANIHNSRNVLVGNGDNGSEHFYDSVDVGVNAQNLYGVMSAGGSADTKELYCSMQIAYGSYLYYCAYVESCHHCLGCIGLKNKSYCILNKQYTKEEWEILAEKIFATMEADGTLGDFFPASMCPFYFNDTLAYLIDDSFTKEEVEKDGYLWRDEPIRADIPEGMQVVKNTELGKYEGFRKSSLRKELSEGNEDGGLVSEDSETPIPLSLRDTPLSQGGLGTWHIDPEVMKVVISDEKGNYYRIVQMEYDFLMKHGLPLPRMHWLDRMKMGFQI